MKLHHSWWRAILDEPTLVPVPLDAAGLPALQEHPLPARSPPDRWLLIAPGGARLCPGFGAILMEHARARPDVDVFYADEVERRDGWWDSPNLKPAANRTLLLACDYVGSPVLIRGPAFERLRGFRAGTGTAAVYDLLLRALDAGIGIDRIPRVMVAHAGVRPRASREDRAAAVSYWARAEGNGFEVVAGLTEESLQLRRRFDVFPDVTLVVPTCQAVQHHGTGPGRGRAHIINLLDSLARTDWPMNRLHVLIGDDVAGGSAYAQGSWPFAVTRIETQRPAGEAFNYAAKMNFLWRHAASELMVLMNDDIVVLQPGWLRALMGFAMDDGVGGVGARLLFGDGRLQHAGMPGGLTDATSHAWIFQQPHDKTYADWALMHREWSMVTGAVFATRRSVLEQVNGFDERLSLEYNDVDLCLRLRLQGYRIVYTPFAELLHYEKASRGTLRPHPDQVALFLKRWSGLLADDPAFHPGFDMANVYLTPRTSPDPWYARPA